MYVFGQVYFSSAFLMCICPCVVPMCICLGVFPKCIFQVYHSSVIVQLCISQEHLQCVFAQVRPPAGARPEQEGDRLSAGWLKLSNDKDNVNDKDNAK